MFSNLDSQGSSAFCWAEVILRLAELSFANVSGILRPHAVARRCVTTHAVVDVVSVIRTQQVELLPSEKFEHCTAPKEKLITTHGHVTRLTPESAAHRKRNKKKHNAGDLTKANGKIETETSGAELF